MFLLGSNFFDAGPALYWLHLLCLHTWHHQVSTPHTTACSQALQDHWIYLTSGSHLPPHHLASDPSPPYLFSSNWADCTAARWPGPFLIPTYTPAPFWTMALLLTLFFTLSIWDLRASYHSWVSTLNSIFYPQDFVQGSTSSLDNFHCLQPLIRLAQDLTFRVISAETFPAFRVFQL